MSFSRLVSRWKGLALALVAVIATVWLGVTGQLGLYIHPRYYVFTMIMAGIAIVLIVGALAAVPRTDEHEGHDHPKVAATTGRRRVLAIASALAAVAVVAASVIVLLIIPPATLTSAAVEQRSLNGSSNTLTDAGSAGSTNADTSSYSVKDWATLIRQGVSADSLAGKTATLTGFVTPDTDDPDNVFYVARFVITCCAVDAQPVGVPVYEPGWAGTYPSDSWVTVVGSFEANPSVLSTAPTVVQPESITAVSQPADPYVY